MVFCGDGTPPDSSPSILYATGDESWASVADAIFRRSSRLIRWRTFVDKEQDNRMIYGYSGKILYVDLSNERIESRELDPKLAWDFIGGYGIGARLLYDMIPAHANPLGPDNVLAIVAGPLTGSGAPTGTRWTVCCKSPLTKTWGDASGSGFFGAGLKSTGYDAVLINGISQEPVYLLINGEQANLHNADHLWGLDTYETDDVLKAKHGEDAQIACIGPAGEKLSLISGIVHHKGRIAARSGVGAVMGSKRLKAVVAKGKNKPIFAFPKTVEQLRRKYTRQIISGVGSADFYRLAGTPGYIVSGVQEGDSPIRNWKGVPKDFQDVTKISAHAIFDLGRKKRSCWQCPIGCWGEVPLNNEIVHQPEYETASAFGSNLLNSSLKGLLQCADICNRYGLDTISVGTAIAFAIECFEAGLITLSDTSGLVLRWGDEKGIVELTGQIARREGLGAMLADGTRLAAERIGKETKDYAMQISGQEVPMHDPRFEPGLGLVYIADATPARHTQSAQYLIGVDFDVGEYPGFGKKREKQYGRGRYMKPMSSLNHVVNTSGLCLFGYLSTTVSILPEWLTAVTGWNYSLEDVLLCGERIANIRQAFNARDGINFLEFDLPKRAYGNPPLESGPTAGFTVNIQTLLQEHLEEMDWDRETATPSKSKLEELGLWDISQDLWK